MKNETTYKKGQKAGPGRPKGMQNKLTTDIKNMIEGALNAVGGEDYLIEQARTNPTAFLALVKSLLPKDINSNVKGGMTVLHKIEREIINATH